ncbi:MAG: DNA-binding protein WhiA [Coriobacteriia bacterium]|nr:DNA-binding protein WhiA [Coriobacteriia bacterium]
MSFTTVIKEELSHVEPECESCSKAMLSALVKSQGTLKIHGGGKYSVEFVTDNASIARFALANFRGVYDLDTELAFRRSVLHNTPNYLLDLLQGPKLVFAMEDMGIIEGSIGNICKGIKKDFKEKECCSAAYLRGAFLGSGYVSEPQGDFHFEISVESREQARDMQFILKKKDIRAGVCQRRNKHILYIKSGQGIADFLAFSGAHQAALDMEQVRVYKSIANEENRRVNADIANSRRTIDAAFDQLLMIKKVATHYGLQNLSPKLQEFILLRIKNREASLSELGALADPPLSKSAMSGRVRRLEQLAKNIK